MDRLERVGEESGSQGLGHEWTVELWELGGIGALGTAQRGFELDSL